MRARQWVVLAGALMLLASCKKTVEGENQGWQRNTKHVQELTALYPSFGAALTQQLKQAEDAMSAARAVSDKEAAAKKMAEANALLDSGFVRSLGQIDGSVRRLREKAVTASTAAQNPGDQLAARAAADDAQRVLRNVDDQLKTGASDAISAAVILRKIDGDVSSASANLDRVIASARQREAQAKPATAAAAGTAAVGAGAATAKPAAPPKVTWKCKYCGKVHEDNAKKCDQCGAPRP